MAPAEGKESLSRDARESLSKCQGYCVRESVFDALGSAVLPSDTVASATERMIAHGFDVGWEYRPEAAVLTIGRSRHPKRSQRFTESISVPLKDWGERAATDTSAGIRIARELKKAARRFGELAKEVEMETDPYGYARTDVTGWW
jgi:hypothetical protein